MMIKISSSRIGRISAQTLDKWFELLLTRMTSQVQKSESAAVGATFRPVVGRKTVSVSHQSKMKLVINWGCDSRRNQRLLIDRQNL